MTMVLRITAVLLLLAAAVVPAFTQALLGVHASSPADVWAVGTGGTVLRSSDGGVTWSRTSHGSADLTAVWTHGSAVWIAGTDGVLRHSSDAGASWSFRQVNGGVAVRDIAFAGGRHGWAVGDFGSIVATTDGGLTWQAQASGTKLGLRAVAAADSLVAYAAGEAGYLEKTTDGGTTWTFIGVDGWSRSFTDVAVRGTAVIVTGEYATAFRSTNGGGSWRELDVRTDAATDVNGVHLWSADSIAFAGGGGSIRLTADGGSTFSYGRHGLHTPLGKIMFLDPLHGWACSGTGLAVLRTTDGGSTWQMPAGTVVNRSWSQRLSASSSIGNTFVINPWNRDRLYAALGRFIYMSADRGESWSQTAVISPTAGSTHSFYISPKDTNVYVVAFTGGGDRVLRSTDRGATWTATIIRNFSSFGMPLEMDGDHPDTLFFGPEDGQFYRSLDFGATWESLGPVSFNSPCDVQVVRDSSNIIWVGDSGPSRISRSTDGGRTWTLVYDGSTSEIPTIANGRQRNALGFATAWGGGGLQRTTDYGATWTTAATTGSTWGVDIAKDDPTVAMFGVYGGGATYLTTDAGGSFTSSPITGSNYAILCYDRSTFFAQQSGGVWKMNITTTVPLSNAQTLTLVSPNGGEVLPYGAQVPVRWVSGNLAQVKIELRTEPGGPWQTLAPAVPAPAGEYTWSVPAFPAAAARIRVSDAADGDPSVTSASSFIIAVPAVTVSAESLLFGEVPVGQIGRATIEVGNPGTGTLVVFSAAPATGSFLAGRSSFSIPAGGTDTLGVLFVPAAPGTVRDTLILTTNAPGSPVRVALQGTGGPVLSAGGESAPSAFFLAPNYPNPFNPTTVIAFGTGASGPVRLTVYDMLGREVRTLVDGVLPAGLHRHTFDAEGLAAGMYLYRLQAGSFVRQEKMMLVK